MRLLSVSSSTFSTVPKVGSVSAFESTRRRVRVAVSASESTRRRVRVAVSASESRIRLPLPVPRIERRGPRPSRAAGMTRPRHALLTAFGPRVAYPAASRARDSAADQRPSRARHPPPTSVGECAVSQHGHVPSTVPAPSRVPAPQSARLCTATASMPAEATPARPCAAETGRPRPRQTPANHHTASASAH